VEFVYVGGGKGNFENRLRGRREEQRIKEAAYRGSLPGDQNLKSPARRRTTKNEEIRRNERKKMRGPLLQQFFQRKKRC